MKRPKRKRTPAKFRFTHLNKSASGEVLTEWMDEQDALLWLHRNGMIITGIQIVERFVKADAITLVKAIIGEIDEEE